MRSDYLIPSTRRVRRIVSEDSLHGVSALATSIERFSNLENRPTRFVGEWRLSQYRYRIREHFKVSLLPPNQWEPAEERNHAGLYVSKLVDLEVPATIPSQTDRSALERSTEELERRDVILRDIECCGNLPSTSVVGTTPAYDHEATFPQGEARKEVA